MNELNENHGKTSFNTSHTIPKQIVDIVDLANSVDNLSKTYRKQLQLDTLKTEPRSATQTATQMFSNIEIEGILV